MSILPLGIAANLTISLNAVPMTVSDTVYTTIAGVDKQGAPTTRTITGAVDAGGKRTLEPIFGGSVSDGDIGIWPENNADLYFLDEYSPGDTRRQSFVTYRGYQYRVIAVADFTDQGGCKAFLASRHVVQDRI